MVATTLKQSSGETAQERKEEGKKDKDEVEDVAQFEGGRLTRRKPGNGNLKRKVCDDIQPDPKLTPLTT